MIDIGVSQRDRPMSEKVKVSLFLEPEVARALKVQAARRGAGGVSELVRETILCAHCREPITDEFVVGIKQIPPGTFGVFFHKDRKECLAASKTAAPRRMMEV
jgi:hypothetical protein